MKKYILSNIKRRHTYDIEEIAGLFGIDRKSVERWMDQGLKPIVLNRKPLLFDGQMVYDFINKKRTVRQVNLKEEEFYCLGCKTPTKAKIDSEKNVDTGRRIGKDNKTLRARIGLCEVCGSKLYRLLKPSQKGLNDS